MCHNYGIFNRSVILTSCGNRYGSGSVIIPVLTTYVCEIKTTIFFVCLFLCWSLSSHSRIFQSYGDVTIAGEGLQFFTYARHSWPLSSEGSLTCHTYCYTGLSFIMVISDTHTHVAERLAV